MQIKKSNRPKTDICGTWALIGTDCDIWPLSKTLWYLFSRKILNKYSKFPENPVAFSLKSNFHAKPYLVLSI